MIKFEHTKVMNLEAATRGMRNPMNSWEKSDSYATFIEDAETLETAEYQYFVGEEDLKLMKSLAKAGSDHRKFMRQIFVSVDITAPLYWWAEADTYKIGTVRNSCSKMHRLLEKPFEMSDFSFDRLPGYKNEVKQYKPIIDEEMVAEESWCWYDNDYDISNYGRVKHKFKNHYRLISGSLHEDGYIFVTLHGKQYPLHRLVAKLWLSETYSEDLVVNHKDGNKQNNFVSNLEWVTQKENIEHSIKNHPQPNMRPSYMGKFSLDERNEIKRLWDEGDMSKRQIAEKYGVSHTCINDIINDKYKYSERVNIFEEAAIPVVDMLNELRDSYLRCSNESDRKDIWYSIIQLLPESYNQKSTLTLNYEVIFNMYHARKNHKLDEWRIGFIEWAKQLPYFMELVGNEEK